VLCIRIGKDVHIVDRTGPIIFVKDVEEATNIDGGHVCFRKVGFDQVMIITNNKSERGDENGTSGHTNESWHTAR
jgi:hypothetical protein